MRRIDVDTIAIAKTQRNLSLLFNKKVIRYNLLIAEHNVDVMSTNSNELIGQWQQGGVLLSIRNGIYKYSNTVGTDATGIGRWVYYDIITPQTKNRLIYVHQCVRSIQPTNAILSQQQRHFTRKNRNIYPRTEFREDSIPFIELTKKWILDYYQPRFKISHKISKISSLFPQIRSF